ncbi:MAG: PDZ domain-containing protein [Gemmatimonadota bacterium]|nr:PDZ domain-containing protein [Gemmatimonadota bacterium]
MTTLRSLALLGALGAALPGPGHAQETLAPEQNRAWIGVRAAASTHPGDQAFALLVADIYVTGPAHRSGVLPGDLIVAANGTPLTSYDDWLNAVSELEPGQPFMVGLMRGRTTADVTIIADRRPGAPFDVARFDTIRARFAKTVDSILQLVVEGSPNDSVVISFMSTSERLRAAEARIETRWRTSVTVRRADAELRRETEEMRRVGEQGFTPPVAGGGGDLRAAIEVVDTSTAPALTPFTLGHPMVLGGIQVRGLTAELARFVGVASGMLVTDVLYMSPAARAGFQGGDVILAVAGQPVGSLTELRTALALAVLPTVITVVRRGEELNLTYPPG